MKILMTVVSEVLYGPLFVTRFQFLIEGFHVQLYRRFSDC